MSCPVLIDPACLVGKVIGAVAGAAAGTVASDALSGIASAIQSGVSLDRHQQHQLVGQGPVPGPGRPSPRSAASSSGCSRWPSRSPCSA